MKNPDFRNPSFITIALNYADRLGRRRIRYSLDNEDGEGEWVTLGELRQQLGEEAANMLAKHFDHTGLADQPVISRSRLIDLIKLLVRR
jgi:hypothetical protein